MQMNADKGGKYKMLILWIVRQIEKAGTFFICVHLCSSVFICGSISFCAI